MSPCAPSAKAAKQSIRIAILAAVCMLMAGIVCNAAVAKGDLSIGEQERDKAREVAALQAQIDALKLVPGPATNAQLAKVADVQVPLQVAKAKQPKNVTPAAANQAQAQGGQAGNNAGDIAREQAIQAIDYCARYMKNFTTEGGNRWNRYRDNFFVPMALLLILPGAVLTQVRAIIAQGNPIMVGQASPLEGIQRAIIGIFLVPCTYLVVNYSIDVGNSIQYTIAAEYKRLQGTDMYEDAMCAEIRAFGVRYLSENEGSQAVPQQDQSARGNDPFAKLEGKLWGKLSDPCLGIMLVPANRDDASMSQGAVGTRSIMNITNAGINTAWSILTAFQMAFMYYLFFVGPLMAALWTWPMKMFKDALPSWVEAVITLAFWSFFWNVVILILALTKSETTSTGLYTVSACNFLATAAVKFAFDFAGLMRGAAGEAERMGQQHASKAGKGAGGGGGGKGGTGAKQNGSANNATNPAANPDANPAVNPVVDPKKAPSLIPKPTTQVAALDDNGVRQPSLVPARLTLGAELPAMEPAIVVTSLPPSEVLQGKGLMTLAGIDPNVITPYADPTRLTYNPITCTWNDPVKCSSPPLSGGPVSQARNTIGSVIGNAIQAIFAYPKSAKLVDPDSAVRPVEKKEIPAIDFVETIECQTEVTQNIETAQTPTEIIEAEESEMKNVAPPSTVKVEEERFSFTPPPMVEADRGKSFDSTMSVSDIPLEANTCNSLLTKMADVVTDNQEFAPTVVANANLFVPQTPQVFAEPAQQYFTTAAQSVQPIQYQAPSLTFAQELAQVYAAHMPQVFAEQEAQRQTSPNYTGPIQSFITAEQPQEEVITVVDFTQMAAPAVAQVQAPVQAQKPTQTNTGLNGLLRNSGLAKAPVNNDVSNSWFA